MRIFTLCNDRSLGKHVLHHLEAQGTSVRPTALNLSRGQVREKVFGRGVRPQSKQVLTLEPEAPVSSLDVSRDPNSALALALADALLDQHGKLTYAPFDTIFAIGSLIDNGIDLAWRLDDSAHQGLSDAVQLLARLDPQSRLLVVAPRSSLEIFRDLCRDRPDYTLVQTAQDALDSRAPVTCLAMREGMLHFRTLCHRLRAHPKHTKVPPRIKLPPPPPRIPTGLAHTIELPPIESTAIVKEIRERVREDAHVLANRYLLGEELGEGGCGKVYKVHDTQMQRDVALKIVRTELLDNGKQPIAIQRFKREVALCAKLSHPHLVPVYDTGTIEHQHIDPATRKKTIVEVPFLAMQLLEGEDLERVLSDRHIEAALIHRIGMQTLDALAYVHENQIVHKDLKPSNLFLSHDRRGQPHAYIMDFGISYDPRDSMGRMTAHGRFAGTWEYSAPEYLLASDAPPTPAIDVYQMGLILTELITGRPLIKHGLTLNEVLGFYLRTKLELPAELSDTRVGDVLGRALAKDPADRYPSAHEFYEAWSKLEIADFPIIESKPAPSFDESTSDMMLPGFARGTDTGAVAPVATHHADARKELVRSPPEQSASSEVVLRTDPRPQPSSTSSTKYLTIVLGAVVLCILVAGAILASLAGETNSPTQQGDATRIQAGASVAAESEGPQIITITSAPRNGAKVMLEGQYVGDTPLEIPQDRLGQSIRTYYIEHPEDGRGAVAVNPRRLELDYTVVLTPNPTTIKTTTRDEPSTSGAEKSEPEQIERSKPARTKSKKRERSSGKRAKPAPDTKTKPSLLPVGKHKRATTEAEE